MISILFATLATRTNAPLRWLIYVIMAVLVATPPLFTAISWGLLGNRNVGLINTTLGIAGTDLAVNIESWWGLVFVSVIRAVGFQFYLLIGAFIAMDRNLEEAARVEVEPAVVALRELVALRRLAVPEDRVEDEPCVVVVVGDVAR